MANSANLFPCMVGCGLYYVLDVPSRFSTPGKLDMKTEQARLNVFEESVSKPQLTAPAQSILGNPVFLAAIDLAIAIIAYLGAWMLRMTVPFPYTQELLPQERLGTVGHPWLLLVLTQVFYLYIFALYDDLRGMGRREIVGYVLAGCTLQTLTITSIFFFTGLDDESYPRTVMLTFGVVDFLLVSSWRLYVRSLAERRVLRVLVVGEGVEPAREIVRHIEKSPWMGLRIVGLIGRESTTLEGKEFGYPVLGSVQEIADIIVRFDIEQVIFASKESWKNQVLGSLSQIQERRPLRIAILPSTYEMVIGKLDHVNIYDAPLIEVTRNPNEPLERFLKRTMDVVLSSVSLILILPFLPLIALAIKLASPGPVFYLQERVGFGGKRFKLIKFRSMIEDAEKASGETYSSAEDPRVTSVGRVLRRFRIDELPQLVNVFKGDMSFVGPRPERPKFVADFEATLPGYNERHKVKPGITGLAQVRSYYDTEVESKLKYDLGYIYNHSFSLDLLIMLETIKVILVRRGS